MKKEAIQISVSIEGSQGLTWPLWRQLVSEVEELGFAGLYLTDHFPNKQAGLELIVALTYLAQQSKRIHFSPLVTPLSFRDPRILARQAATLDDLSGGRMILGLGTGWHEQEHETWGYALGNKTTRLDRFAEGLAVITGLLQRDEPLTLAGHFYQLQGARLLPRPQRPGGPPILIGGNGPRRILPLVAQYADIWNANNLSVATFQERSALLDNLLVQAGRQPSAVKRTIFLAVMCGRNDDEIKQRLGWLYKGMPELVPLPVKAQLERIEQIFTPILAGNGGSYNCVFGLPDEAIDCIRRYAAAGVEEFIIQWPDVDDIEGLRLIAKEVMPYVNR